MSNLFRFKLLVSALILIFLQSGCSADLAALRNCEKSGEAHFDGHPLASRSGHEKAQRFKPENPANCLLYVVREKDWWSGARDDRTFLMLTSEEIKPRSLPANPAQLRNKVIAIRQGVYAMWELPSNAYFLNAFFHNQYFRTVMEGRIAQVRLDCRPGGVMFFSAGDKGFNHNVFLKRLNEEDGKIYVVNGLRSIGFREIDIGNEYRSPWREELWYKSCPAEKQN